MCDAHQTSRWILCPHCDMTQWLPQLMPGERAVCTRCDSVLRTAWPNPGKRPLAFAISALVMLIVANCFPFISINVAGLTNQITLMQIPRAVTDDNYPLLATLFLLFVQLIPAVSLLLIMILFSPLRLPVPINIGLAKGFFKLKDWGMAEIFMAGVLVSFVKLMAYGRIELGVSFWPWCLFCILQLRAFQCIDRRDIWRMIADEPPFSNLPVAGRSGISQNLRSCNCCAAIVSAEQPVCPRCHHRGYARKRQSLQWTLSLLLASLILYIPANILPIMVTDALGNRSDSNIMAGVIFLWGEGSWPIAMIIFIASIMVPGLKMLAIGWLSWNAGRPDNRDNHCLQVIYEMVEFVGRWSMIDVFVIAVLSALVRIGGLMNVYPASGAILFSLVVILTMFSAMAFDPRLLWDRQRQTCDEESAVESK